MDPKSQNIPKIVLEIDVRKREVRDGRQSSHETKCFTTCEESESKF